MPDGRIVAVDAVNQAGEHQRPHLQVVLNWFEELKMKVPAGK
jgi:hypothetical protein